LKTLHLFAAGLAVATLASCATYRLQPVTLDGSKWSTSASHAVAQATADDLSFEVTADWSPEIQFEVKVTNKGAGTVVLDSDQFRLFTGTASSWTEVPMIQSADYYRRAERWTPDHVVVVSSQPVYRQTTTTIGGSSSLTIVRTDVVPAPQTVYVDNSGAERLARLRATLFYTQTLGAGETKRGLVFAPWSKSTAYYKLVIPVNGKEVTLYFQKVKEKTSPFTNVDF